MMTNQTCAGAGMGSPGLKKALVSSVFGMYRRPVAANSATDLGRSKTTRRTSALHLTAGAFFVPAALRYGGCAWDAFGRAGFRVSRSANPRTAVTIPCLAASGDGSESTHGATSMLSHLFQLTPEQIRNKIARHRAMAIAQLRSKSSLSVRKRRYDEQMARARFFEAMLAGGAK